ncbi:hypothetical protein [Streptomyces xanthophaeus]|uniref:hypothetical protein n=1 Tax=Streptomyces xanthophaeus TaxID=67385 RepID=UPI002647F78A|nr:hypothetical protein [Streptomyces xanthophaeus]WKD36740.1 hypothetical protein KO717_35650 [Streptomyces xanthophaeus]
MPDENGTKEYREIYRRAQDGTPVRGDLADGQPLPGMAVTREVREVLLREHDREAPEPPVDGPGRADLRIEPLGPGPADACPPEAFRPAEEEAPGIADAVDRCLDGTGAEGAFVRLLMERLPERGHAFWLIGGAVRDLVDVGPEAEPNDLDFAGTLPPLELLQEIEEQYVDAGLGDHRPRMSPLSLVVHLSRPGQRGPRILEYKALAVTDFPFSAYGGSLTDDAASRDLTVNSLYYDHGRRLLVDPTGEGIAHLRARPRVLASRNTERAAGRSAAVLLRFLKFALRYPDADLTRLRDWAAALPADLSDRLGEDDWPALRHSWRSYVPDEGRQRALETAGLLGPAVAALVDRLAGEVRA